jgi:hypothetical protein
MDTPYQVTIEARDSQHKIVADLNDKTPTPKEGGGGWEEIALAKRGAVIVWKGRSLLKLSFGIVLDGGSEEQPIAGAMTTLRHMYRPDDRDAEPPVVRISCPGDVIPYLDEGLEWLLTELEWTDAIADEEGNRILQQAELTLTEYQPDVRLETLATKNKRKHRIKRYRITRADLGGGLGRLAHKFHVRGGWQELAEAQNPPRTDPRLSSKDVGKWLVIPGPNFALAKAKRRAHW